MDVETLRSLLASTAGGRVYHAAQLRDLRTYIELGHVASRAELFKRGTDGYTPFDSDADDAGRMRCDSDVFGNLLDQGRFMASGRGIPNVYGPITLVFTSDAIAYSGATDVRVRSKAIWSADEEGRRVLDDPEEVTGLYDAAGWAQSGEIQIVGGTLYLADLMYVLVNSVVIDRIKLVDAVAESIKSTSRRDGSPISIIERTPKAGEPGWDIYANLITWSAGSHTHHGEIGSLPEPLIGWFENLSVPSKRANVTRFAKYMHHGTISALQDVAGILEPHPGEQYLPQ